MATDVTEPQPFIYFPAPPPRKRTTLGTALAPVRWLIGIVILGVLLLGAFAWSLVMLGFCLVFFPFWGRVPRRINRLLVPAGWVWERQGSADLRRWAFEKRLTDSEREAFFREEHRRVEAAKASLRADDGDITE
jgi:hypothetical protein